LGSISFLKRWAFIRNSSLAADGIPPERNQAEPVINCGTLRRLKS